MAVVGVAPSTIPNVIRTKPTAPTSTIIFWFKGFNFSEEYAFKAILMMTAELAKAFTECRRSNCGSARRDNPGESTATGF